MLKLSELRFLVDPFPVPLCEPVPFTNTIPQPTPFFPSMHNTYPLNVENFLSCQQLTTLWKQVSEDLRADLGDPLYDRWFADFLLSSVDSDGVVLSAPGSMYAIWVEENFKESVISTFRKYLSKCDKFRVSVKAPTEEELLAEPVVAIEEISGKGKILSETISASKLLERGLAAGLVENFRFDNFVAGDNCELALAAAKAVADDPGRTYQPLYFNSACGLGKTHLLNAIGWESLRQRPKSKIISVTAEQFANNYIDAIQNNSLAAFRKRYREADLLIIDDVQFLGRKEGLQREFFHTFNRLNDQRKQVVLASDCPASEINSLEDRLVSRFQSGLSAEIHRPGLETRAAILRRKRDDWDMKVSDDLINAIVERVKGNVRVLEGALIRVAMVATMNEEDLTTAHVHEVIADICDLQEGRQLDAEEIKRAVSEQYDVSVSLINGKKRTARVAEARQVAMFLCRQLTELSLVEVAACFAKDHGTVIYAVKKVKKRSEDSASFKSTVELIKRRLVRGGGIQNPRGNDSVVPENDQFSSFRKYSPKGK